MGDIFNMNNAKYEYYKKKHPEWSEDQIWTAVSLDMESERVIEEKGSDVDPNDPDMIKDILDGARNWLREVLPQVFAKVSAFFDKMISTIGDWIQKGLTFVIDAIARLLNK